MNDGAALDHVLQRLDANLPEALERLKDFIRIPSVGTDPAHDADTRRAAEWLCAQLQDLGFEAAVRDGVGRVVFLSSRAVHDARPAGTPLPDGTPVAPQSLYGRVKAEAEAGLAALDGAGFRTASIRATGIYGPGRSPITKLREGRSQRIVKQGQVFNRIHVADIAATLEASLDRPRPGAVYNVTDDEPAPPQTVIEHAARLTGLPLPPEVDFETADLSPMARSFYGENKRVRNRLIREELGVALAYPTYREGLAALKDQP